MLFSFFKKIYYLFLAYWLDKSFIKTPALEMFMPEKRQAPILFVTVAFNNSYILHLHLLLIKSFISDDYCHIVIDNSSNAAIRLQNKKICIAYNTAWISLPHNPWTGIHNSRSHGLSLNWALQNIVTFYTYEILGFLDHDIFPIRSHSIQKCMRGNRVMGVLQSKHNIWYLWPGYLFLDKSFDILRDINFLPTRKTDTGGRLSETIFTKIPQDDITLIKESEEALREGNSRQSSFYYCIGNWIHTVNASYWKKTAPKENDILNVLYGKIDSKSILNEFDKQQKEY